MNLSKTNHKLLLPLAIILSSVIVGGFYYSGQVSKQQGLERQHQFEVNQARITEELRLEREEELRLERERQQKEEAQNMIDMIDDAESELEQCERGATNDYLNQWMETCKELGRISDDCIEIIEMPYSEYITKIDSVPFEEWVRIVYGCSCDNLPKQAVKVLDEWLDEEKEDCRRRYNTIVNNLN